MTIKQMLERQAQILAAAKAAGRDLTTEGKTEFDQLQRQIDEAQAAEAEEQRTAEATTQRDEAVRVAVEAERARETSIREMCRNFDIEDGVADGYVREGMTEDAVRAAIMEHLIRDRAPIRTGGVDVVADEGDKFRAAASEALMMRGGVNVENPADGAREHMGASLKELAIECLQRDNVSGDFRRMSADDVYTAAMRQFFNPTAAFPAILDQAIEKSYVAGYNLVPVTFDRWTKKGSLSDFKTHDNYYVAGPVGEFLEVPEGGELKHDVFKDAKLPTRKLKTYGRQFTLTRQAFINDDIGLVTSLPARYAAAARKTLNTQCYEILVGNAAIYDGANLFCSAHKNLLAAGTGVTQDAMQTMIMALASQKDQFGQPIIIRPATIIVPAGMQFEMYTLLNSPTINTTDNTQAVNPMYQYRSAFDVVEDPTINAMAGTNAAPWFMVGDRSDCDFMEVDYLNGQEIPNIRRSEKSGQLGYIWDIYLDWGIAVMDYRGVVKNPGVVIESKLAMA